MPISPTTLGALAIDSTSTTVFTSSLAGLVEWSIAARLPAAANNPSAATAVQSAGKLPQGFELNSVLGILVAKPVTPGDYYFVLCAENELGEQEFVELTGRVTAKSLAQATSKSNAFVKVRVKTKMPGGHIAPFSVPVGDGGFIIAEDGYEITVHPSEARKLLEQGRIYQY